MNSCIKNKNEEYNNLLLSLEKNYTKQEKFDDFTKICWKVDKIKFHNDSIEYDKALDIFYKSDKDFLVFLLEFKRDKKKNNWIIKKNPCSSYFDKKDLISNSKGALILIDNFLTNNDKSIVLNDYTEKLDFSKIEKIINEEKNLDSIKLEYKRYIREFKN